MFTFVFLFTSMFEEMRLERSVLGEDCIALVASVRFSGALWLLNTFVCIAYNNKKTTTFFN